jgi:hypothetical protein
MMGDALFEAALSTTGFKAAMPLIGVALGASEQSFVGPVAVWQREPGSKESSVAHGDAGFSLDAYRIIAGAVVVEEDHLGATAE